GLGERTRPIGEPLATFKRAAHQRMGLEALELLERVQIGVRIVEVNDKADRHQIVAEMIEERSAAGVAIERPAERVLHQSRPMLVGRDLPELLEPDAVLLRLAALIETKALEQR